MTKMEMYEMIKETCATNEAIVEFCEHEMELEEKRKASAERAKAKKAEENATLENQIVEILSDVNGVATTKEIAAELGVSFQKVTPRLTALVSDGRVTRNAQGKHIYFSVAQ